MTYAYIRPSRAIKSASNQIKELLPYHIDKWVIDDPVASGCSKPKFDLLIDACKEGDCILVYDITRIAKNLEEFLEYQEILTTKKVVFISIKEGIDTRISSKKTYLRKLAASTPFAKINTIEQRFKTQFS